VLRKIQESRQIKNTDNTQITNNSEKAHNTKYSKTILLWFSRLLRHMSGNAVGLFYNAPDPHTGLFWPSVWLYVVITSQCKNRIWALKC